jgi:hypothetical protein
MLIEKDEEFDVVYCCITCQWVCVCVCVCVRVERKAFIALT